MRYESVSLEKCSYFLAPVLMMIPRRVGRTGGEGDQKLYQRLNHCSLKETVGKEIVGNSFKTLGQCWLIF